MYERKGGLQRSATTGLASSGGKGGGKDDWYGGQYGQYSGSGGKPSFSRYNSYGGPGEFDGLRQSHPKGEGKGQNWGNGKMSSSQKGASQNSQKGAFQKGGHSKSAGNIDEMAWADITRRHQEAYKTAKGTSTDEGRTS